MSTPRINNAAPVTRSIVERGLLARRPFVLADVGVSGGIGDHWRQFGSALRAFGFDPLVRECERLNRIESNPGVRYHDYFLVAEKYSDLFPPSTSRDPVTGWSNQPFERSSAARAQRQQTTTIAQWFNNENPDVVYTERKTSLDAFFGGLPDTVVDFIKVDTDGHDYEVLSGAQELLTRHQVLGVLVEVQFHGISHLHSNLFANIDRLLRERGFSLFDLETYRYTRGVLPGHFEYSIPAQTKEGQILAGDALYLRDLAAPGYEGRWGTLANPEKLLKLVCLLEMFGVADCAAEVVLMKQKEIDGLLDTRSVLTMLARQVHPRAASLEEIDSRFAAAVQSFYPRTPVERLRRSLPGPMQRGLSYLRRKLRS